MKSPREKPFSAKLTGIASPITKNRNKNIKHTEETSDDEVLLCRVRSNEGSPERSTTQRSYAARMYHQSPQRLSSSSRILSDSWQDASTEPLVYQAPNEENVSKARGSAIETDTARVLGKRKAETPVDQVHQTKILRQKKEQAQDEVRNENENEASSVSKANTPATVLEKQKTNTSGSSEVVTKALRRTPEHIKQEPETKKEKNSNTLQAKPEDESQKTEEKTQPAADKATSAEGSMGPPNQQTPKRYPKEEVLLCRVRSNEGSPERSTTQRSYAARMYHQSPQRLSSSSRILSDSWQDASTEPLVPRTPNEENVSKTRGSAIETDTPNEENVSQTRSSGIENDAPKVLGKQNENENEASSVSKADAPATVLGKRKADTSISSEVVTKALRRTPEHIKQEPETKKEKDSNTLQAKPEDESQKTEEKTQPAADKVASAEGSMGPPDQQTPKRSFKEEEEARTAQEIADLMKTVKCLPNYYKLVDKIGEGTFSTVYKAQDIRRDYYDNSDWEPQLLESAQNSFVSPSSTSGREATAGEGESSQSSSSSSPKDLSEFVALKRVYDTSSPRRIANEIKILMKLKGSKCISPLITAFRQEDQVFVVMPYIQHDEFKPTFHRMELIDIKYYMKSLFTALQQLHRFKILHRDVKPNNFLYNIRRRAGYLIDFGLAESEDDIKQLEMQVEKIMKTSRFNVYSQGYHNNSSISHNVSTVTNINNDNKFGFTPITRMASSNSVLAALTNKEKRAGSGLNTPSTITTTTTTAAAAAAASNTTVATSSATLNTSSMASISNRNSNTGTKGYIKNDPRLSVIANRAGTRGFRAPEVLMRVTHQTCAIDIWAAGVILLCLLTNTYPFFLSNDEADALIELGQLYGLERMQECARVNNRNFETNVIMPKAKLPWSTLIEALNTEKAKTWSQKDYDDAVNLLRRSMELDPEKRITAEEALKLDFLQVD